MWGKHSEQLILVLSLPFEWFARASGGEIWGSSDGRQIEWKRKQLRKDSCNLREASLSRIDFRIALDKISSRVLV